MAEVLKIRAKKAIFLKNFNFEQECEPKTFVIVHDVPRIFCDIRKKINRAREVCLKKKKFDRFWKHVKLK